MTSPRKPRQSTPARGRRRISRRTTKAMAQRSTWPAVAGWLLAVLLALTLLATCCNPVSAALTECIDATCRITAPDGGRGTGCVFERSQGTVFVLTAAHVVGPADRVQCEFWRSGHQSQPLAGTVILRVQDNRTDAAVVALADGQFGGRLPPAIPLASRDYLVAPGQTLCSVGCANGAWSTGWQGHALGYAGEDLRFVPAPAMGRSGSALFDADGQRIVGLVRARTLDNGQGVASSVQSLYGQLCRAAAERQVQCGPNGCTVNQYRLLPYRQSQESRPSIPYPTLPSTDLSETNRKLDRLVELLLEMRPGAPAASDERTAAVDRAARNAENAAAAVKEEQEKLQQKLQGLNGVLEQLVGDPGTLGDRFRARLDRVKAAGAQSTEEITQAYLRDLLAEKLGESKGLTTGKLVSGALGLSGPLAVALVIGLWFLGSRIQAKVQSGEPLLVQQMITRLHDKIDELRVRVAQDKTSSGTGTTA
jgi:hypothetical protein